MDRYAVVGNPVAHSRSPAIHALFAEQTRQPLHYERLLAPLDAFATTVREFAAQGGRGCNVTIPFKFEAAGMCARRSDRAERARAVNTLRFDRDGWFGDNTDGVGLLRDIELNARWPIADKRVLMIGAGGAAWGVLGPLLEAVPAEVIVANRSTDKAEALVSNHADMARRHGVRLSAAPLQRPGERFDLVINASASSLHTAEVPVPATVLHAEAFAIDLMYGASARPFLDWAGTNGAQGRDGLGMLVEQAAESFALWRGVRPDTAPVLRALREAVDRGPA